jgi:hypothetical protein
MKHPNESFISLNLRSDLLNKSAVAKKLGLSPQNFSDKLNGRGKSKRFTPAELIEIENIIKNDLEL